MHTAEINVPHLPCAAHVCHIVPYLRTCSLISLGQLCDAGCAVLFLTDTVSIGLKMPLLCKARGRAPQDYGILNCLVQVCRMEHLLSPCRRYSQTTATNTRLRVRTCIPERPLKPPRRHKMHLSLRSNTGNA
jgi:hypothetical protein